MCTFFFNIKTFSQERLCIMCTHGWPHCIFFLILLGVYNMIYCLMNRCNFFPFNNFVNSCFKNMTSLPVLQLNCQFFAYYPSEIGLKMI